MAGTRQFLTQDPYAAQTNSQQWGQFTNRVQARRGEMVGQDIGRQDQMANKTQAVNLARQQAIQSRNAGTVGQGGIDRGAQAAGMAGRLAQKLARPQALTQRQISQQQAANKTASKGNNPQMNSANPYQGMAQDQYNPLHQQLSQKFMDQTNKDFSKLHTDKAQKQIDAETKQRKAMWGARGMGEMMASEGVQSRAADRNQTLMAEAQRMGWEDKQKAIGLAQQNIDQMSGTDLRYAAQNMQGWEQSTQMMIPLMERLGYGQGQMGVGTPRMG
jgi:hypothetical protein